MIYFVSLHFFVNFKLSYILLSVTCIQVKTKMLQTLILFSRYLVCKFKRNDCHQITEYMSYVNEQVPIHLGEGKLDVLELVPLNVLMEDRDFFDYIYSSNNRPVFLLFKT